MIAQGENIIKQNTRDLIFLCGIDYLKKISIPSCFASIESVLDEESEFTLRIGQLFFDLLGKIDLESLTSKLCIPKDFLHQIIKQGHVSGICNICSEYKTRLHDHLKLRHDISRKLMNDYTKFFGNSCYYYMHIEKKVTEASKIMEAKLKKRKRLAKLEKNNKSNTDEKSDKADEEKKEKTYNTATEFSLICVNCNEKVNHFCGNYIDYYKAQGSGDQIQNSKKRKIIGKVIN